MGIWLNIWGDNYKKQKVLIEATLTNFLDVYIANNEGVGISIPYTIVAINSGTNIVECHYGRYNVIARNQNGTITNNSAHINELDLPLGTGITDVFGVVNGLNKITINLTATSGISPTSFVFYYTIETYGKNVNYTQL